MCLLGRLARNVSSALCRLIYTLTYLQEIDLSGLTMVKYKVVVEGEIRSKQTFTLTKDKSVTDKDKANFEMLLPSPRTQMKHEREGEKVWGLRYHYHF
jgi:hypothetical protein